MKYLLLLAALALGAVACGDDDDTLATREEMLDPEACADCHPNHFEQWQSSMHAYAADDPVFLAMNARAQEQTDLGDFCINCHAPMAVVEGITDGSDVDQIPQHLRGVTCYFCHTVIDVPDPPHNNPLVLANDNVMRGALGVLGPPVENGFHGMEYSQLHDRRASPSSRLCGACHDIVLPGSGVELERTFTEWQTTVFNSDDAAQRVTCGGCHMKGDVPGVVADFEGVPLRFPREHTWPGIDVAITPWPGKDLQLEQIARELDPAINPKLCVTPNGGGTIEYNLDNVGGGHNFPTGASQDRRAWAEIVAYDAAGDVVFQTGVVADGEAVATVAETDTSMWQMRDVARNMEGELAHMFWDVHQIEEQTLLPAVTNDRTDPRFNHSTSKFFSPVTAARVTAVVHIRPIGLDVIDDLIGSGHLDAELRNASVTHTVEGTRLEWTLDDVGFGCVCRDGPC
jgi:nitrate/TMAO reductase-like tetraheme cytochrome c subunit